MDTAHASVSTRVKVGVFASFGLGFVIALTVVVNNRPFWWKPCQLVKISVDDATGLKTKSPVRSLGIDIGYLKTIMLYETHVTLGICLTAPVKVLGSTRAYLKGEGLLGDKFVELKPVQYLNATESSEDIPSQSPAVPSGRGSQSWLRLFDILIPSAEASVDKEGASPSADARVPAGTVHSGRSNSEIPVGSESQDVQHLVNRVDDLVQQMSGLTDNLKRAIDPEDLKRTMRQLNHTLDNASKALAPEGGLNQTAQRTLAKLEDSIEQLRDLMTRVNKGEGSVGMLLNDPVYAQEIQKAIQGVNQLLNRVAKVRFVPDLGGAYLGGINGGRGWFNLGIWPKPERYYLIGIAGDSRGRILNTDVSTTVAGSSPVVVTSQVVDYTMMVFTAMMGKVYNERWDLSVGLLYGDGALSAKLNLGGKDWRDQIQLGSDVYLRIGGGPNLRAYLSVQPVKGFYLRGGMEALPVGSTGITTPATYFAGGGITFDDEDIKLLFALK